MAGWLSGLMGGLGNFASSGVGQSLTGAALGGLTAKATGGDWRQGAALGGLGGALNYGSGAGGNLYGEGVNANSFGSSALGQGYSSLMGEQAQQASIPSTTNGYANHADVVARNTAWKPTANAQNTSGGLFEGWGDSIGEFGTKYKDTMDMTGKGLSTLGNIYSVYNQSKAADSEADRRREYDAYTRTRTDEADDLREQQAKQAELAFNKSKLSSYY